MGHRALVAVAREGGGYAVYLAPDGAADRHVEPLLRPDAAVPPGLVDGPLRGRARSVDDLLESHLDPLLHEALVVVHRDGSLTPYAVLPFVLATANGLVEGNPPGAILSLTAPDGSVLRPGYVRGWLHGTTDVLGEAVDAGVLEPGEAVRWLRDAVERLGGDRHEVTVLPPEP